VNEKGQVVGGSQDANGNGRAFLWQSAVMTDLNTLVPADSYLFLVFADAINSQGDITGIAVVSAGPHAGEAHAFLATPTNGSAGSESHAIEARVEASRPRKIVLPENVRNLLQQRPGFGRLGIGVPGSK
jgi:probable HAF family extracellular repeat protein